MKLHPTTTSSSLSRSLALSFMTASLTGMKQNPRESQAGFGGLNPHEVQTLKMQTLRARCSKARAEQTSSPSKPLRLQKVYLNECTSLQAPLILPKCSRVHSSGRQKQSILLSQMNDPKAKHLVTSIMLVMRKHRKNQNTLAAPAAPAAQKLARKNLNTEAAPQLMS